MKFKLLAGAALTAVFAASGASAQPLNGFYGALDAGVHRPEGISATSSANAPDGSRYNWTFDQDEDFAGFARVGYRFSPQVRIELEGGYRSGDLSSVRGSGDRPASYPQGLCTLGVVRTTANPTCGDPDGQIEAYTLMLNAIYDFNFSFFQRLVPFVGVGAGANRIQIDTIGQFSNVGGPFTAANPSIQNLVIDDEDLVFAYQALAGLTFNATERLSIDLTYRYLGGTDVEFASTGSHSLQPGTFEGGYNDQSLTLGLRYAFQPPPPAPEPVPEPPVVEQAPPPFVPPPAPPPPPPPAFEAREFIVYFPFDQAVLTPEAQTVVQEAATYAGSGAATRIAVVGHADTSGSAAYNIRLSERRARAVADSMVALGVNPSLITADWRGEAAPAVATGDGVKEPLNRRATVSVN